MAGGATPLSLSPHMPALMATKFASVISLHMEEEHVPLCDSDLGCDADSVFYPKLRVRW